MMHDAWLALRRCALLFSVQTGNRLCPFEPANDLAAASFASSCRTRNREQVPAIVRIFFCRGP